VTSIAARALATSLAAASFTLSGPAGAAPPVEVSYQLSGSPGQWVLDFSLTNNVPSTNDELGVYLFGLILPGGSGALSSPDNWPVFFSPVSTDVLRGSGKTYTTNWLDYQYGIALPFGQTLSGFRVSDGEQSAPNGIDWVAYAIGPAGPDVNIVYTGPSTDYIGPVAYNPGFEGTAFPTNVPEPGAAWLLGLGLGVAAIARRRA